MSSSEDLKNVLPACAPTDNDPACYTASWYLMWDQVIYWLYFQIPLLAFCIMYEWLEVANFSRIEKIRAMLANPMIAFIVSCFGVLLF
jgi:hypothetical protein